MIRIDCRKISGEDIGKSDEMKLACECFTRNGYAILDHVLSEHRMTALRTEFYGRYNRYLQDREYEETMEVGKKRFIVPLELTGGFADPEIYGNPFIVALVREMLDTDAVLDTFGAVVSLSGAEQQHVHRDAGLLFDAGISMLLPAHAVTVMLPLVEMNAESGTTTVWPGSHRWKGQDEMDKKLSISPTIPPGSAYMWDYRLYHRGMGNASMEHRPVVYGTYARAWYRDAANFQKATQRRLWMSQDFMTGVPKDRRRLFARVE
jgi:ectoine hydroxylase-related dioxygenase (phytanoyl-CoA dioxygenase family)